MGVEEITITLSGGAPWGFRLQGGVEHQRPLQVAKVRKRSKACRAGLREGDELVSINDNSCANLSHAQAMNFIDSIPGSLRIRVKRAPVGFQSVVLVARAPSPRIDKEYRAALKAKSPSNFKLQQPSVRQVHHGGLMSPTSHGGLTSPVGSEAYYGETDSDADVAAQDRHRRPKRRSPSNTPGKAVRTSPEMGETSEMSGYDSAPDAQSYTQVGPGHQEDNLPGVVRQEVVYQHTPSRAWSSYTSTETSSISADEQSSQDLVLEENNGFQELTSVVPLVSPERAKGALMLSSPGHLVPMVGPVNRPVDEELTKTYMDKAKQAKLNRGETQQDKQVKEARTKCRTIASLLTDAPNPHSKGVLMFKKRRQRSKKYTLTSYGSVDEDMQPDSQDEDSHFLGSESEVDEEGFSAAPDPTWDSDYLDKLEKRAGSRGLEEGSTEDSLSAGLSNTTGRGARLFEQQRRRAEEHAKKMTIAQAQQGHDQNQAHPETQQQALELPVQTEKQVKPSGQPPPVAPKPTKPPEVVMQEKPPSAKTVLLVPSPQGTPSIRNEDIVSIKIPVSSVVPVRNQPITLTSSIMPPPPTALPELPPSSVLNRTARPFAPGFISHRAATAPVVFRPNTAKKSPRPVSVAVVTQLVSTTSEEKVMDVPSVSFSVSQKSIDVSAEMPSTSTHLATVPHPPLADTSETAQSITPHLPSSMNNVQSVSSVTQTAVSADIFVPVTVITAAPSIVFKDSKSMISTATALPPAPETTVVPASSMISAVSASPVCSVGPVANQEKATVGSCRTGILQEARRRSAHKPMFKVPASTSQKNSPNPALLSMVQNLDERHKPGHSERVTFSLDTYSIDDRSERIPPPVPPKPQVVSEMPQIAQAEGKGAELFARRQNRKDLFVVDSSPSHCQQQHVQPYSVTAMYQPHEHSSATSSWKYSPNVRAPPPIGYNPLLAPSCPLGAQRGRPRGSEGNSKVNKSAYGIQKEGIKAIEVMRRQPYQLNSAMFCFGGDSSTHLTGSTYQNQRKPLEGHTLSQPRQVPVKTARVYEIKRFSTPTPMSAPTITPTVIAPRAHTTLAEPLSRADMTSPNPALATPPPSQHLSEPPVITKRAPGLPELPKISATAIFLPTPYSPPAPVSNMSSYSGLKAARQFKSAPELSALPPNFLKPPVQSPKPRFIATRVGIQPQIWRPGALHH